MGRRRRRRQRRRRRIFHGEESIFFFSNSTASSVILNRKDDFQYVKSIQSEHEEPTTALADPSTIPPPKLGLVSYNCLLIPVVFALWWYWSQRKARKVFTGTDEVEGHEIGTFDEADFSSWEQVVEQDKNDSSVRFVRWIKRRDRKKSKSTKRRQEDHPKKVSCKRTMRMAAHSKCSEQSSELSVSMLDEDIDDDMTDGDCSSVFSSETIGTEGRWQRLEDSTGVEMYTTMISSDSSVELSLMGRDIV